MASTSKKPSGLTVVRDKFKFTFGWKLGEEYEKQVLEYSIATSFYKKGKKKGKPIWKTKKVKGKNTRVWTSITVGAKTTAKSITFNTTKYPNGLAAIAFRVKGKAKKKNISSFVTKEYVIVTPNTPAVGVSVVNDYTSSFAWSTAVDDTAKKAFKHNEWQHAIVSNCNVTKGDKVKGWSKIETSKKSSGKTFEERGWDTQKESRTRWLRARSVGWAGLKSPWAYKNRVYAIPNPATNVKAQRYPFANSGYAVSVSWSSPETVSRPIDVVTVDYAKIQPIVTVTMPSTSDGTVEMDLSCPTDGVGWTSVIEAGGINNNRTVAFTDSNGIPNNQVFYISVVNRHDNNSARSIPIISDGGYGVLDSPSVPEATVSVHDSHIYSIRIQNRGTQITNAAIAIYFRSSSTQSSPECIGIIPPGETFLESCRIPDFPEGDQISFGARAFVGNYSPKEATSFDDVTIFNPTFKMSSDIVWTEDIPLPPTIKAEAVNESTIMVTWNQTWIDATQAELSWADHDDAWESTAEPTTYIVPSINSGKWRIAELGIGTWYVRVRLMKTNTDGTVQYSSYSKIEPVKLSSSPDTPSLLLSADVISKTGSVTCYWAYVSGDGTGQKQAQIFEAFPEYVEITDIQPDTNPYESVYYELINSKYVRTLDTSPVEGKTYYIATNEVTYSAKPLRSTESAQHITLSASDEDLGWLPGETHHLAVRVTSMSGENSDGFSPAVPVIIADELYLEIISSSLVYKEVPTDFDDSGQIVETRSAFSMIEFPLEFTVKGFNPGDSITAIIDRFATYRVDRPDETEYEGFIGETILMKDYDSSTIRIMQEDLIGNLDDGASYRVTLILNDSYGQDVQATLIPTGSYNEVPEVEDLFQELENPIGNPSELKYYELINDEYILSTDTEVVEGKTYYVKSTTINPSEENYYVLINDEYVLTTDTEIMPGVTYYTKEYLDNFEVHWDHQAVLPSAEIEVDHDHNVTFITPVMPDEGYLEGDVIDIYRLSADPPELIFSGALMNGTKYVDPYPAFGQFGGHRIVYRTFNGDFITEGDEIAMVDYAADENPDFRHTEFGIIIDFDGRQIVLPGNVSFSNQWKKDFTFTKYLGGSVQGDWNPAVERTMSANTTIPIEVEAANLEDIRRLAVYPGICHIRTPDGSSFACNIDVNDDREEKWTTRVAKISLSVTRCDPEGFDAMTYAEWIAEQEQ